MPVAKQIVKSVLQGKRLEGKVSRVEYTKRAMFMFEGGGNITNLVTNNFNLSCYTIGWKKNVEGKKI